MTANLIYIFFVLDQTFFIQKNSKDSHVGRRRPSNTLSDANSFRLVCFTNVCYVRIVRKQKKHRLKKKSNRLDLDTFVSVSIVWFNFRPLRKPIVFDTWKSFHPTFARLASFRRSISKLLKLVVETTSVKRLRKNAHLFARHTFNAYLNTLNYNCTFCVDWKWFEWKSARNSFTFASTSLPGRVLSTTTKNAHTNTHT